MRKKGLAALSACAAICLVLGMHTVPSYASETEMITEQETVSETETEASQEDATESNKDNKKDKKKDKKDKKNSKETEVKEDEPDLSMAGELIFAKCEDYINIRKDDSVESEVTAKIRNFDSATVICKKGEWFEIESGNAHGYVKAEYFATGKEAEEIARQVAYNVATVHPDELNIRAYPGEDTEVIDVAYHGQELEVVDYTGDWMKVALGNDVYGYINAYYVDYTTYYPTAETLEEEEARLRAEQESAEENAEEYYEEPAYTDNSSGSSQTYSTDSSSQSYSSTGTGSGSTGTGSGSTGTGSGSTGTGSGSTSTGSGSTGAGSATENSQQSTEAQDNSQASSAEDGSDSSWDDYDDGDYEDVSDADIYYDDTVPSEPASGNNSEAIQMEDGVSADTLYNDGSAQTEDTASPEADYTESDGDTWTEDTNTDGSYAEDSYSEGGYEETYTENTASGTGQQIADYAVQFVGNPYVWGGTSLTSGADCSGFVQSVFANFGIYLSRTADAQAGCGTAVSMDSLQAGDLVFYSSGAGIDHVAIYIGGGQIVHAANANSGIIISGAYYDTPVCAVRCF